MQGAAGAAGDKIYIDDIFSTFLYTGTSANQAINNGIDLSGEGGMTWLKARSQNYDYWLFDTERGSNKAIRSNLSSAEITDTAYMNAFNNNGFTVGSNGSTNYTGVNFSSWTFREAPGFFDVVTYSGDGGTNRQIPHNLGSVPGCIMVKPLNDSGSWIVYHKALGATKHMVLNDTQAQTDDEFWNDTEPTSTHFTVRGTGTNSSTKTFVAYLFAGGDNDYNSVDFDGNDYISVASSSDLTLGTGDFAIEFWAYPDNFTNRGTFYDSRPSSGNTGITIGHESTSGEIRVYMNANSGSDIIVQSSDFNTNAWQHIAVTRDSGTVRLFIGGVLKDTASSTSRNLSNTNAVNIGYKSYTSSGYNYYDGKISNFRVVKGSAVYTSAFTPSTTPLNTITNTVLLCCNEQGATAATKTPTRITAIGNPVKSSDNPFGSNPSEAYKFGEGGDQNIIKTGSYVGNGSSNGPDINLGWEPQWLLIKRTNATEDWMLFDHMRTSIRQNMWLDDQRPNLTTADGDGAGSDSQPYLNWTSTGFKLSSNTGHTNGNGDNYMYVAVRRPDGAVGKLPTAGSQVFTPVADSSGEPMFKTPNHYVDMSLQKNSDYATQAKDWNVVNRLRPGQRLHTDNTNAEDYNPYQQFDYQNGMSSYGIGSGIRFSWNWKRYAGFDVVTYDGNSTPGRTVQHNLGRDPEMIWIKCRNVVEDWVVGHKGLNGGTNPWEYSLRLNGTQSQIDYPYFNDTAPTSTLFTLNNNGQVNGGSSNDYIAMLFASVEGISKCGSYTGTGYDLTVTTGFSPRFVIIKRIDATENWFVLDTVRGWASGNDQYVILNSTAQQASADFGNPVATGFLVKGTSSGSNTSGGTYIYYAHA